MKEKKESGRKARKPAKPRKAKSSVGKGKPDRTKKIKSAGKDLDSARPRKVKADFQGDETTRPKKARPAFRGEESDKPRKARPSFRGEESDKPRKARPAFRGEESDKPRKARPGFRGEESDKPRKARPGFRGEESDKPRKARPGFRGEESDKPRKARPGFRGEESDKPRKARPGFRGEETSNPRVSKVSLRKKPDSYSPDREFSGSRPDSDKPKVRRPKGNDPLERDKRKQREADQRSGKGEDWISGREKDRLNDPGAEERPAKKRLEVKKREGDGEYSPRPEPRKTTKTVWRPDQEPGAPAKRKRIPGKENDKDSNSSRPRRRDDDTYPRQSDKLPDLTYSRSKKKAANNDNIVRLNKFIADAGLCSRRDADKLIESGAVRVNGEIITLLGTKVSRDDKVQVGDQTLSREKLRYVLLNKPKGFITTLDDPQQRDTVLALVDNACRERIYPVGRLDRNTTGLLLFTNDGDLAKKLTHPSHNIRKMYHVVLDSNLKMEDYYKIEAGMELEDGFLKVDAVEFVGAGKDKKELGIEIHSGKNRIIRRLFEELGYNIMKLDRVVFAGLNKKDLPRGKWRHLTAEEVGYLKML